MLAWLLATAALAGYGDAVDGHPTAAERAVHVWVDAVRASPDAFGADYAAGGCAYADFESAETGLHTPLWRVASLSGSAVAHAQDMDAHDMLDHTSSDGTPWDERIAAVYSHTTIGEALAYDPAGDRHAVLSVWMCSPPHRAIVLGDFDEIGIGVAGPYYAADVGLAGRDEWPVIPSASQEPDEPTTEVTFRAVWFGSPPDAVEAVLDEEPYAMTLVAGTVTAGTWEITVPTDGECHTWYVRGDVDAGQARWPESGTYGWGDCDWTDAAAAWMDVPPGDPPDDDDDSGGCDVAGAPLALAFLPLLALRRRRASA